MKWRPNPVTKRFGKTVTITEEAVSIIDDGAHASTKQRAHIHSPGTEHASTVRAKHGDVHSLHLVAAKSGRSIDKSRISATGYINELMSRVSDMPEMLDMIVTQVTNLRTQRAEERKREEQERF